MVLKLKDGRKELYQWDVGVVADVTDENINEVHFSNLRYGVSFNIEVQNGTVTIPPEVLQSGADVFCWAFVRQENGGYTKKEQIFNVEKRPRPADYIYEPTEVLTWETLKQEIEEVEKGTIPTMDKVNVWELEAGAYYVNRIVFYATPHPPVYLNCVEMQSEKGLLYVHIDISNNATRNFYLFANGNIYFGYSTPGELNTAGAVGSISSVVASIKNEITSENVDGIPTKKAVYNFGENIKTELLANIGNKADKTDLEALKTEIPDGVDVQINGTSIVKDGVANIPLALPSNAGVVTVGGSLLGITLFDSKTSKIAISKASNTDIDARSSIYKPIVPNNLDYAVKVAMCDGKGAEWTEEEKAAARARLGIDEILNTLQGNINEISALVGGA